MSRLLLNQSIIAATRKIKCFCSMYNKNNDSFLNTMKTHRLSHAREKSRFTRKTLNALYRRRDEQGPEPDRHRSEWPNWNYNAELFAFGRRLKEEFDDNTLRTAFIDKSYIAMESVRRAELEITEDESHLQLEHNEQLAAQGGQFAAHYISAYLSNQLPNLPEQGVRSITDHLLTDEMLSHIGKKLGITDLVMCEDLHPSDVTLSLTFKAVIGALLHGQGKTRTGLFVQDFIITQLVGKELSELWHIDNPMGILADILADNGRLPPEPRLLGDVGSQTVVAAYLVGIFSDKELLGKAPGETISIAEEMAARDALKNMLGLEFNRKNFNFGKDGYALNAKLNMSLLE